MFARGSRYADLTPAIFVQANGRRVPYVPLRTIPADLPVQSAHVVTDIDRLDLLANDAYADPTQFWRLCDANRGTWPDDLLSVPGRLLRVPVSR